MATKIQRIDRGSVIKILDGMIDEEHSIVIKFYASHCQYCHNLAEYYNDIANSFDDVLFFAFNMDDGLDLEQKYGFFGVPTFAHAKTAGKNTKVTFLADPDDPNEKTWYRVRDIEQFINKNK